MKKHIAIAAGLAVLSTSAFATKARMNALGQGDDRGSFFIQDSRNVFRNASDVNDMTNYIVTEWGTANNAADAENAPHAEGGFFRSAGQFNYGVYLGSDIDSQNATKTADAFLFQDNNIDLFFGGDMGVKWGVNLGYSSSEDEQAATHKKESDSLSLGLGVERGPIEGYVNLGLKDESKGTTATAADKWEADTGINAGVSYDWMDYTFYVDYDKTGYEKTVTAVKTEVEDTALTVGVGHNHEVSATSRLFTSISYVDSKSESKGGTVNKTEDSAIPLTLGFEADATSWLALRGSISQNVILGSSKNTAGKKTTQANSTDVAAGATLNFGKLKVDGVIGTAGTNGTAGTETGTLSLDRLMTRVAVHYWF